MRDRLQAALGTLHHRGPDRQGEYQDGHVWLGHTRLSILDLSPGGNQPMPSADGRFVISYNGEVYNFRELAAELDLDNLRSRSDTEVVLRLFSKLGVDSFIKLNGMFAFAVYDTGVRKLWLVRDRLGIKPLYYQLDSKSLTFASEIKGIIALAAEAPACNVSALHEWWYYGNPLGGRTLYNGVQQLLPGHYLEIDLDSFKHVVREYWSLKQQAEGITDVHNGKLEIISETRRLLDRAVQRQLISDVPVGVFLSGGVDSSAIAAFASRHYEGRLATYSVGFDFDREGGELPKAKRVAELYGTEHHEIHVRGENIGDLVEKMVFHHDMPFSDAANIPLYLMAAQIKSHTKVVLQGDGGDELFGGYRRYSTLNYYPLLHWMSQRLGKLYHLLPESALYHRIERYVHALAAEDIGTTIALLLSMEGPQSAPTAIFSARIRKLIEESDPLFRYRECQRMFAAHDVGNLMSLVDLMIVLPDTYLEKVDRSTMAASVEVRVPFLDHDLVDFVVRLPGRTKMPWGRKKWLLKAALDGIVPDEILFGPKTGLSVPFGGWLKTSLRALFFDHLSTFWRRHPDFLDQERISELFKRTSAGTQDHSVSLWKILNFCIWANNSNVDLIEERVH